MTNRSSLVNPSTYTRSVSVALSVLLGFSARAADVGAPYQATGFKVGEVTDTSAIVWTRLTRHAQHNASDGPMVKIEYDGAKKSSAKQASKVARPVYPDGVTDADIRDAVPGAEGEVRIQFRPERASDWQDGDWQPMDP